MLEKAERPTVGVVLVNWNGAEFTIPCVLSLLAGTTRPDKVLVVDNGSADDSVDRISAACPQVSWIRNANNQGFAGANNQGIEVLLSEGIDYIWVLNNDTVVASDCLAILIRVAGQHPAAGGISGKIFFESPRDHIWYAGALRHPLHRAPVHFHEPVLDAQELAGAVDVEFISGCCMFVPASTWRQVGGLITSYVAYSEDSEWCWRIRRANLTLLYVPAAHLWHRLSASVKKNSALPRREGITPYAHYLMSRNHLWTVRKHAGPAPRSWPPLAINVGIQARNAVAFALRGDGLMTRSSLKALMHGLLTKVPDDIPQWERVREP